MATTTTTFDVTRFARWIIPTADTVYVFHVISFTTYDVIDFERYLILAFDESNVRDLNENFKPNDGTARAEVKLFATYDLKES